MNDPREFKPILPGELEDAIVSGETIPLAGDSLENDGKPTPIVPDFDPLENPPAPPPPDTDTRLYLKHAEGWQVRIKQDWQKEYCYAQNPGEDYYHLILNGEIYLTHDTEKYCLRCALRRGDVTTDRLHWQREGARPRDETE